MKNNKKLLVAALTGLIAGTASTYVIAEDAAPAADSHSEKASCKSKEGCNGHSEKDKNSCKAKEGCGGTDKNACNGKE